MSAAGFVLAFAPGRGAEGASIAVVERAPRLVDGRWVDDHHVRFVERRSPGESIAESVAAVATIVARPELEGDVDIVLDVTEHGRGLLELLSAAVGDLTVWRVTIAGETEHARDDRGGNIVAPWALRAALAFDAATGRLKLAEGLPLLRHEVQRAIEHPETCADDSVFRAVALALWAGRRRETGGPKPSPAKAWTAAAWLEEIRAHQASQGPALLAARAEAVRRARRREELGEEADDSAPIDDEDA